MQSLSPALRTLAAALTGFAISCLACRLLISRQVSEESPAAAGLPETPAVSHGPAAFPAAGAWAALSPEARSTLGGDLGNLDADQRNKWLLQAMERTEPERTALLRLLLLGWAKTDPAAAADWTLSELAENSRVDCFGDVAASWGARDALGLAQWWDKTQARNPPVWQPPYLKFMVKEILRRHDPLVFARFQEMPCCRHMSYGDEHEARFLGRKLSTPGQIAAMAAAVTAEVAYTEDTTALQKSLSNSSAARHANKKDVWNVLFEDTAVAWHRSDPAACEAWLSTFPENAQTAARHFISEDEKSRNPPPAATEPAEPASPPIPPQQRLTAQPPVPGPAEDAARKDWSDWWRADAAAAEVFLTTAAWSDDLKFRARAMAYSSAP